MHMLRIAAVVTFLSLFVHAGLRAGEHKHEDEKGPHGGVLLVVGEEVAHVEVIQDAKAGKITLYILGKDAKTALAIKEAPKLNLRSKDGNKQIETKGVEAKDGAASQYEATDEALKAHPLDGRIALTINDKKYNVTLKDEHGH